MAVAASGPNTKMMQFDWFTSARIFPVLPAQEGKLLKTLLVSNKNENFWTIGKGKVTMYSKEIENEMTELQVFIWRSVSLHLWIIF